MKASVYQRPGKPQKLIVQSRCTEAPTRAPQLARPEPVILHKGSECWVTPPAIADEMVAALGPSISGPTLEPSAGTGNLIDALQREGHSFEQLMAIEREPALIASIRQRFSGGGEFPIIQQCFLDWAEQMRGARHFQHILMNPPFRGVKHHIAAARSLLGGPGHQTATLVALVPISFECTEASTLRVLPADTFSGITVHTKIIQIQE